MSGRSIGSSVTVALLLAIVLGAQSLAAAVLRAPGGGAVRALVIGINSYSILPVGAQLGGAVADATDVSQALAAAGIKALTLVDGAAVRSRIIGEMNRLIAESRSGDLVIITYAGHGMKVPIYPQWKGIDDDFSTQIALSGYGYSGSASHDVIVDKEMRAWWARFDAKGVDVLVVIDSCFGGGMRFVAPSSGTIRVRTISGDVEQASHDSFAGIDMSQKEARADIKNMSHVTFLAGATPNSVVPEMAGIDLKNPKLPRGALSYFVARSFEGVASNGGDVTRAQLFKFVPQNVRQATNERQRVDLEPRISDAAVLGKTVFRLGDTAASAPLSDKPQSASAQAPVQAQPLAASAEPVRVAVVNGAAASFSTIEKGRAPFISAERDEGADLVWDVGNGIALSRGDPIMSKVDGSLLGGVIDRTWAVLQTQKLSRPRVLPVRMREEGKSYAQNDHPELVIGDVRGSYLSVVNIAADGTLQMLFPTDGRDSHIGNDEWTFLPIVEPPFGADHVVAVATGRPATELIKWLVAHNGKHDAASLPAVIAEIVGSDETTRLGMVGLYTSARR